MDSVTYREQLYPIGHGYPLWCPTPPQNLPPVYRDSGIRIGDVGLLSDEGGFDYLWNVHHARDHPVNLNVNGTTRVPPGDYAPLPPLNESDPMDVRVQDSYHRPSACIAASTFNVRQLSAEMNLDPAIIGVLAGGGVAFEFTTAHDASAALALPLGARRTDALRLSRYQKYAAKHAVSWYQYVNIELERGALNGTLYLVTGTDKCSSWGATSVSRSGSNNALSVAFTASSVASTAVGLRNAWMQSFGASTRIGEENTMNQCVFSRGFVISIRELLARLPVRISGAVRTVHAHGGADRPWIPGSGRPFSSSTSSPRSFESSDGGSRENCEDIEHAENENISTESIMDEGDVEVVSFPSYRVQKSPAAFIGEDLLRTYADAKVALVHDNDCMLLATSAVKEGKGLLEIYHGTNQSGCKVQVEDDACVFVPGGDDLCASHTEEEESSFQTVSSRSINKEGQDLVVSPVEEAQKTPARGADSLRFTPPSVDANASTKPQASIHRRTGPTYRPPTSLISNFTGASPAVAATVVASSVRDSSHIGKASSSLKSTQSRNSKESPRKPRGSPNNKAAVDIESTNEASAPDIPVNKPQGLDSSSPNIPVSTTPGTHRSIPTRPSITPIAIAQNPTPGALDVAGIRPSRSLPGPPQSLPRSPRLTRQLENKRNNLLWQYPPPSTALPRRNKSSACIFSPFQMSEKVVGQRSYVAVPWDEHDEPGVEIRRRTVTTSALPRTKSWVSER